MSTKSTLEDIMEKKIVTKGFFDAPRIKQDVSGRGTQAPAVQAPKHKHQHRRLSSNANFRPDPSSRKCPSVGISKASNGNEPEVLEDSADEGVAELGSLQFPGSKKQNLNHLLNFHFADREQQRIRGRGNPHASGYHGSSQTVRPSHGKDSFIQANCQFIVRSDDDVEYHVDHLVNWNSVEQIIIRTYGGTPGCPICLAIPSAAKITKCGHIFCWSCILRYFSYGDGHSLPCPICFKSIVAEELKSVVAKPLDELHVGDIVEMQLMCRKKDAASSPMPIASKLGFEVHDWENRFQKLLRVDPKQLQVQVISRERSELETQLNGTIESLETEFVKAAMVELDKRVKCLRTKMAGGLEMPPASQDTIPDATTLPDLQLNPKKMAKGLRKENYGAGKAAKPNLLATKQLNWDEYACFYQASDGSNAFMNSLNMAMLWKCFGQNPAKWPQALSLVVLEIEVLTTTADLRKRLRFLQHIPLNSSIQLIEFELKGVVSKDIISEFNHQLSQRKRKRKDRLRHEIRRERLCMEAERIGNEERPKPKIESLFDFPECGSPEAEAKALDRALKASLCDNGEDRTHEPNTKVPGGESVEPGDLSFFPHLSASSSLTFAQALNTPIVWKRSPTFPVTVKEKSDSVPRPQLGIRDSVGDSESSIPAFRESVSDGIASAFASFALSEAVGEDDMSLSVSGQKKKGRKKGKVLFANALGIGSK